MDLMTVSKDGPGGMRLGTSYKSRNDTLVALPSTVRRRIYVTEG